MSDFFTRLAARVLGLSPTLQPLIAPIFAQEQPQGDTGLFEILLEEEVPTRPGNGTRQDAQSEHERKQPQVSQSVYVALSEQPATTLLSTTEERGKNISIASQQVLQQPAPMPISSASEQFREEPDSTINRETPVIDGQKESLMVNNAGEQYIQVLNKLPLIKHKEETPAVDARREIIGRRQISHATIIADQQGNETSFPGRELASDRIAVQSPINDRNTADDGITTSYERTPFVPIVTNRAATQRSGEMPAEQKPSERPVQPAPTIQVTIGRVEIRATPLPSVSTPERPTLAPAVKSLDDYLRQREEGRVR